MSEPTSIIEESPGVRSSKRVAGLVSMGAGIILLSGVGVAAAFNGDMPTAITCAQSLAGIGAALLSVTTIEHFAK